MHFGCVTFSLLILDSQETWVPFSENRRLMEFGAIKFSLSEHKPMSKSQDCAITCCLHFYFQGTVQSEANHKSCGAVHSCEHGA